MLVSKIKPCMSKYKSIEGKTADGSIDQSLLVWRNGYKNPNIHLDTPVNCRANTCKPWPDWTKGGDAETEHRGTGEGLCRVFGERV